MLVTRQPVLRRFWYPVIPIDHLSAGPQAFTLLNQKLVLWLDETGQPAALEDRCCHRTAALSKGSVQPLGAPASAAAAAAAADRPDRPDRPTCLTCPYHGWQFDRQGICQHVPQLTASNPSSNPPPVPPNYKVKAFPCQERYGYAWVCLHPEPLTGIPDLWEIEAGYRLIHEFYEPWQCAGLRVMENEFDTAHPTFVHTGTFGSEDHPTPDSMELEETEWGLNFKTVLGVTNPTEQQKNLQIDQSKTLRTMEMTWFMPFTAKLRIGYPNGKTHVIVNTPVPIDDRTSQIVQFCLRNDSEAETPAAGLIAFDRAVTLEDKAILETTDYDVPLDPSREQHMMTDKPGLIMRRKLAAFLKAHGETEQTL